jgi:diaminohydroxyphosphoribosylaminopyrimidine deaminase/5-amino-6-(5-phosphoribosylamino)uracil reductase
MVGCVITQGDTIVGQGHHQQAGTAHAEINALLAAGDNAAGATAYVTLEPCAHTGRTGPCADALLRAGVARVVVAMTDPFVQVAGQGIARLRQHGVQVDVGCLTEQAEKLNCGFLTRVREQRPYVTLKMGMSLDGKIALANGVSQWITSPQARADVQLLRAQADAVLTGSGTVLADNPSLLVREAQIPAAFQDTLAFNPLAQFQQPQRIVIDSQDRLSNQHLLNDAEHPVWVINTRHRADLPVHIKQLRVNSDGGHVSLPNVMEKLGQADLNHVLVEAGPGLAGALLAAHCVDEIVVYQAPIILGNGARSAFTFSDLTSLDNAVKLTLIKQQQLGPDQKLTFSLA